MINTMPYVIPNKKFDTNQNGGGFRASESLLDKKYRHKLTWNSLWR